jgi:predicted nucleotide-binding protein
MLAFRKDFESLEKDEKELVTSSRRVFSWSLNKPCQVLVLDLSLKCPKCFIILHEEIFPDLKVETLKLDLRNVSTERLGKVQLLSVLESEEIEHISKSIDFQISYAQYHKQDSVGFESRRTRGLVIAHDPRSSISQSFQEITRIHMNFEIKQMLGDKQRMAREGTVNETKSSLLQNVFIVHGRDYKPVNELKAILSEHGFNPVVLFDQAGGSRTIIEKLEKHSNVGYAFAILTPDDRGGFFKGKGRVLRENLLEDMQFRARQNVILEFGYFIGKLGRDKVCCLCKGNVELPSDMLGIVPIRFEESVHDIKDKIVKELEIAGYELKVKREETERHNEDQDRLRKDVEMLKRRGINPPL